MNPFSISGSWKVDPDHRQDRGNGPVTSYKLSPEEIQVMYGNIQSKGKLPVGVIDPEQVK